MPPHPPPCAPHRSPTDGTRAALARLAVLLAALACLLAPATAAAQRRGADARAVILGVVRDAAGRPMAGVHVSAVDAPRGVYTRDDGAFVLPPVEPGVQLVRARRIGYAAEGVTVVLAAGDTADIEFSLTPVQELPTVVTEAERRRAQKFQPFEERRRSGFGSFITRDQLERWTPSRPSDALRRVAGVRFEVDSRGRKHLVMSRAAALGGSCRPVFFVDGAVWVVPADTDVDQALPTVDQIEGIEVYKGPASVPVAMNLTGSACGVVAIWTR